MINAARNRNELDGRFLTHFHLRYFQFRYRNIDKELLQIVDLSRGRYVNLIRGDRLINLRVKLRNYAVERRDQLRIIDRRLSCGNFRLRRR